MRLQVTIAKGAATLIGPEHAASPDGRYRLVLEGEIHPPATAAEILAAFRSSGPRCFASLGGAFVCAVVDTSAGRLTVARDHFGMKSLFMVSHGDTLALASTIEPLLARLATRTAEPAALRDYLADGLTDHAVRTLFTGIHAVPPAHYMVVDLTSPGNGEPAPFWQPSLTSETGISFEEAASHLRQLFFESVGISRSPGIGATLSGGTDTSAIVMALRQLRGTAAEIHTYSYIPDEGAISEESWIDIVNAAARSVPHKVRLHPDEWTADFDHLVGLQEQPFGTIAVSAQYRLFQMAARTGDIALLSGVGADELMGGHLAARLASLLWRGQWIAAARLARHGQGFWRTLARAAALTAPAGATRVAARAAQRRGRPWIDWGWLTDRGAAPAGPWWLGEPGPAALRGLLWRSVRRALPAVLRYEDRNAAAAGIRARHPFLTRDLAELVFAIPEAYLIGTDGHGKFVLREALRGLVPDSILDRREKVGFSVPLAAWTLRLPAVAELLEEVQLIPAVSPAGVAPLLAAIRDRRLLPLRECFVVWRLVGLAAWARRFDVTFA